MIKRAVLFSVVLVVAVVLGLMWREASYGSGPRDTSVDPAGPLKEVALVSNAVGGTVSLIDLDALEVIGTLNVIPDGANVGLFRDPLQWYAQAQIEERGGLNYAQDTDLSRDGSVLFISRGFIGDVVAMDIASGNILWRTPIAGIRSDHMAMSPDGKRLYVAALIQSGNIVEVLDTQTGKKLGEFSTGIWPHDVHVSHDNKRVYVASLGNMQLPLKERNAEPNAYSITVVDTDTLKVVDTYTFDAGIRPFQLNHDATRLYAQLSNTHAIVARDLDEDPNNNSARIDLPVAEGVTESDWDFESPHHGLALTPDEKLLCVAGRASDYAAIVSAEDLSLIATIDVGNAPSWAAVNHDGRLCILPNNRSDNVSVIDLKAQTEIVRLPLGRGPKHATIGLIPESVLQKLGAPTN